MSAASRAAAAVDAAARRALCGQSRPDVDDAYALGRQHAVLQAVQVASVDGRHELAGCKTEDHPGREVVLADTVAQPEVLVEHLSQ